jgi:hypothetical protein
VLLIFVVFCCMINEFVINANQAWLRFLDQSALNRFDTEK